MYKVNVTSHPKWEDEVIFAVKMCRMVTKLGLAECKTIIENMMGKKWDNIERRLVRFQREPYTLKVDTLVEAEQMRIEFVRGGFTVEVIEDHGQDSRAT